ncbi:MAG: NAD(P)H-dependent oxidoreductase subunit E, partial [Planctomycetes bacterium]|nr:NAD(P)H-dependent oxidoreductase subunit E [Planctomycetota bacterium]
MIVQQLGQIQRRRGWLPEGELRELARRMHTPLYRLEEVSSFFPHFRRAPPARVEVKVCRDMSCHLAGAAAALAELQSFKQERKIGKAELSVCGVSCLGRCDRAPAACVESHPTAGDGEADGKDVHARYYLGRSGAELCEIVTQTLAGNAAEPDTDAAHPIAPQPPWLIDLYEHDDSLPPYAAVRRFLEVEDIALRESFQAERERVLRALETAGLLGMGGAGGRAYKKWRDVLEAK